MQAIVDDESEQTYPGAPLRSKLLARLIKTGGFRVSASFDVIRVFFCSNHQHGSRVRNFAKNLRASRHVAPREKYLAILSSQRLLQLSMRFRNLPGKENNPSMASGASG